MKGFGGRREKPGPSAIMSTRRIERTKSAVGGWPKAAILSLFLHVALVICLTFNLGLSGKKRMSVYHVTLRPYCPPGGTQSVNPGGSPGAAASLPATKLTKPEGSPKGTQPKEMSKPAKKVEKPDKKEIPASAKKDRSPLQPTRDETRTAVKIPPEKGETLKKETPNSLQQAIEDIHKKVALDKIQSSVARREKQKGLKTEGQSTTGQTLESRPSSGYVKGPTVSSSGPRSGVGGGSEAGKGSGPGIGPGAGGYPVGGVPWGSPQSSSYVESKQNDYYSLIWAKIKSEWSLPEDFQQGTADLETIIVIVMERDGKVRKSWFEKRSGNARYDQMAMRAIAKASPLPPIPTEFSDNTVEIAVCFHPE